jgi:hypothetical protein
MKEKGQMGGETQRSLSTVSFLMVRPPTSEPPEETMNPILTNTLLNSVDDVDG